MLAADTAAERADQLAIMAQRLLDLVSKEAEDMRAHRIDRAGVDAAEKERLVHAWRLEISRIRQNPSLLQGLDPQRKEKLKTLSKALEERLEEHAHALAAMKTVTEGLVRAIAGEVAQARGAPAGYAANGAAQGGASHAASGMAVNAKI